MHLGACLSSVDGTLTQPSPFGQKGYFTKPHCAEEKT